MLGLSQSRYIDLMLKRFNIEESKRGYLPIGHGIQLSKKMSPKTPEERNKMSSIPYASTVRSIIYSIFYTRLDVIYTLGIVSRFQTDPAEDHWKAVKNILKYLRRTKGVFLIYSGSHLKLEGYTDSSF